MMSTSVFRKHRIAILVGCVSVLLSGCATQSQMKLSSIFETQGVSPRQPESVSTTDNADVQKSDTTEDIIELEPLMPSYSITTQASARVLDLSDDKTVVVSFEDIPLEDFVEHVFTKIFEVDFVIDPQTSFEDKSVTLQVKKPLGQVSFLSLFNTVLEQHNLAMRLEQEIVFLYPKGGRRGLPDYDYGYGRTADTVPNGSNIIFQIIPIDYIDAMSAQSFLVRLANVSPETLPDKNLIGLRASRQDILRALDVIALIDRPSVLGQQLSFVKLEFVPVSLFISQVSDLLRNEGVNVAEVIRFTPLSRQNGVIIHARNRAHLDRISFWKDTLDTAESTDDKQYFMYYPENIEAEKLSLILGELTQLSQGLGLKKNAVEGGAASSQLQSNSNGTEDLKFVVDKNQNVIIIYGTATKYKNILPLLKKLDVTPSQVLIEARLIEVTLTDQLSQGIDWSLFGGGAKRNISTSQISSLTNGSFAYTISGIDYNVALNLLQNQDRLKVLSSPRIVVASGESASINVGTEIPVLATQSADVDTDRVLQSVQYRSTGVDLNVTPTVNSRNVISLEISQNVSETSENASSGIDSPIILNRSFQTKVFANSGQALVLGGLIRENNSTKKSQIPLLGSIPGVGRLFSSDGKSTSRTELVVFITPRIISNSSDIQEIKNLFLQELDMATGSQ